MSYPRGPGGKCGGDARPANKGIKWTARLVRPAICSKVGIGTGSSPGMMDTSGRREPRAQTPVQFCGK